MIFQGRTLEASFRPRLGRSTVTRWGAAMLVTLLASPAFGQDSATRAAARQLGMEGVEAHQSGDTTTAIKKLSQAYAALKVPSLGLWLARALVQAGRWVEAAELYLEVTRLSVSGGQADVQRQAQTDAASEREALLPRIPTVQIEVKGAEPSELHIEIDGTQIPSALVGAKRPTDPGAYVLTARLGARTEKHRVTLTERSNQRVEFEFEFEGAPAESAESAAAPGAAPVFAGTISSDAERRPGSTQRIFGWVSLAVGGAGFAVGGVAGLMALSQNRTLEQECPDSLCPPDSHPNVDRYDTTRAISTAGFIVGALGTTAGVALLLTAPRSQPAQQGTLQPWLGLGSAGVRGSF